MVTTACLQVKYSPSANLYVTASKDGDIKLWDGVSNKCINTFEQAHDGAEVCSVLFSRNAKVPPSPVFLLVTCIVVVMLTKAVVKTYK